VVEDSSVLANTYVGIGLELSHSIVDGGSLLNLHRGVLIEIADSAVMRANNSLTGISRHVWTDFGSAGTASAN
jgi:hypothetical protein